STPPSPRIWCSPKLRPSSPSPTRTTWRSGTAWPSSRSKAMRVPGLIGLAALVLAAGSSGAQVAESQAPGPAAGKGHVEQGWLQGAVTADGLAVYKGVPFAKPPLRDLRWREPQPAARWNGVRP